MTKQTNETHAVHLKRSINEKKVQITVEFSRMCWLATENIPKIRQKRNFNLVKKGLKIGFFENCLSPRNLIKLAFSVTKFSSLAFAVFQKSLSVNIMYSADH